MMYNLDALQDSYAFIIYTMWTICMHLHIYIQSQDIDLPSLDQGL